MALIDLVAPLRCFACGTAADGDLCECCAETMDVIAAACPRCGGPSPPRPDGRCDECRQLAWFRRGGSLLVYGGAASRLVLALKRRGRTGLAVDAGDLLAALARRSALDGASFVTFVPGGSGSRRAGFEHTHLLASAVARALDMPSRRVLRRVRRGPRQADVPLGRRRANVHGRFAARPVNGPVLLVDDVFTTGSTADECARVLREAGAASVDVLTLARTPRLRETLHTADILAS